MKALKNSLLTLLIGFSFQALTDDGQMISEEDYSKEEMALLEELTGKYSGSDGASLQLHLEKMEEQEPDLFNSNKFLFSALLTDQNRNEVEAELTSLDEKTQTLILAVTQNDCDDPGCYSFEGEISVQKIDDHGYTATAEIEVVVDAEDLSHIYMDNEDELKDRLEKLLDDGCKSYYGKNAKLYSYEDDYKYSVYCTYTISLSLTK